MAIKGIPARLNINLADKLSERTFNIMSITF